MLWGNKIPYTDRNGPARLAKLYDAQTVERAVLPHAGNEGLDQYANSHSHLAFIAHLLRTAQSDQRSRCSHVDDNCDFKAGLGQKRCPTPFLLKSTVSVDLGQHAHSLSPIKTKAV